MTLAMKMHDERWEGRKGGREEGLREDKLEIARRLLDRGFSMEDVSDMTGIDLDTVKKSAEEK